MMTATTQTIVAVPRTVVARQARRSAARRCVAGLRLRLAALAMRRGDSDSFAAHLSAVARLGGAQ